MKLLKKIGLGILVFIILLLVLAFFLPRELNLSVTSKVDSPANYAYNILNDFKNQEKWDPWLALDTTMTFAYSDVTLGEGAYVDYEAKTYGKGRTTRKTATPSEFIELETTSKDNGGATMTYKLKENGESTDLTWEFNTEIPFPMNLLNFVSSRYMKKEMKVGISNISKLANERWKSGIYDGFEVTQAVIEDKNYVIQRGKVAMDKVPEFYTRNLAPLFQKIQSAGVEMEGKPSGLVYGYDAQTNMLDMAAAIPIKEDVAIAGAGTQSLSASKIVSLDYYGDPQGTEVAHGAIDDFMRDRGLLFNYPVVEEYVTDPSMEEDPSKWLTKIRYYLADQE